MLGCGEDRALRLSRSTARVRDRHWAAVMLFMIAVISS